jgi:hypothetical protein
VSWWKRKPKDVIPNPRDNKKRRDIEEAALRTILRTSQFFVFAMAFLILLWVTYAPV